MPVHVVRQTGSNMEQGKGRVVRCRHRAHSFNELLAGSVMHFFVNRILSIPSFNSFPYNSNYEVSTVVIFVIIVFLVQDSKIQ